MFDIQRLPFELRTLVFRECFSLRNLQEGLIPSLIQALRPNEQLYHEALDIFCPLQTFALRPLNDEAVNSMSITALRRIRKLKIHASEYTSIYKQTKRLNSSIAWDINPSRIINIKKHRIRYASNIRSLHLVFTGRESSETITRLVQNCILDFPLLQTLIVATPPKAEMRIDISGNATDRPAPEAFPHMISDRLMVEWEEEDLPVLSKHGVLTGINCVYTWTVPNRQKLTWSDDNYFRSIPKKNLNFFYEFLSLYHQRGMRYRFRTDVLGFNPRTLIATCALKDCQCVSRTAEYHSRLTLSAGKRMERLESFLM